VTQSSTSLLIADADTDHNLVIQMWNQRRIAESGTWNNEEIYIQFSYSRQNNRQTLQI